MQARREVPHDTVQDYLQWEGDWELWHGAAVAVAPSPGLPHQDVAGNLYTQLRSMVEAAGCKCRVYYEVDWHVAEDHVLRPDVLVVCKPNEDHWITRTPELVVEVISPGSVRRDTIHKRGHYRDAGVRFYLLADPAERTLRCLHLDEDGEYVPGPPAFDLHGGCRVELDADRIWEALPVPGEPAG